ncbi:MAG: diaminopimelate decarboxylase [Oscillospiraceae bacterium]|nr:diaminopimelate decarboxylase [Oscillospiraceae bacterium]
MFISDCLGVNAAGRLTIGGQDTLTLAEAYGTPLYVMDETAVRNSCRRFKGSIGEFYGGRGLVAYAGKAFLCKEMCRIAADEGMGIDVASSGELMTALSVDFPAEKIIFHGNNKTAADLAYALQNSVGYIVVDNIHELELLEQLAASMGKRQNIMIRVTPGVSTDAHLLVRIGGTDSKFGFGLETGKAFDAVKYALGMKNVRVAGIHCHIGSQIFDVEPFELAARVMLGLIARVKNELGYEMEILNLGGGFAIKYIPEHNPVEYERYMKRVSAAVKDECQKLGINTPFIVIEPGRSIVASAWITLYRVGGVKEIPGVRTYVSVDGGLTDNPRYSLYKSVYDMTIANRAAQPKIQSVTVAGRCCETDLLGENVPLQEVRVGDTIAVLATGAYNYSMASHYNRLPKPAVVMIGTNGQPRVIVCRETYEDILRQDV